VSTFLISILAAALYSVASARLYVALGSSVPRDRGPGPGRTPTPGRAVTLGIAGLGAVLHLGMVWYQSGLPDALRLPFFTALSLVGLGIVVLQLLICLRQPAEYLGLAVYPLAAVALMASQASHDSGGAVYGRAIQVHVALSVLAYAVLALTAVQAVLVAVQRHFLTQRRPGGFLRALPPLETTEALLFALLSAGLAFLTLSLASGFLYLDDMFAQKLVHKTILSCSAWLIFAVLLFGRWRFGWRGRRFVHWTLGGFALLLVAYFGSKLVVEFMVGGG